MQRRRAVTIMILLLLGGTIINVATAWIIAVTVRELDRKDVEAGVPLAFNQQGRVTQSWWVERWDGFGSTVFESGLFQFPVEPQLNYDNLLHPRDLLPGWIDFDEHAAAHVAGTPEPRPQLAVLRGWPCRSLGCVIRQDATTGTFDFDMAIDPGAFNMRGRVECALPLRPLWPGFAINTIFYSLIIALLWFSSRTLRRAIRLRRGLCPACGYPIGTSPVCTECGASLPSPSR